MKKYGKRLTGLVLSLVMVLAFGSSVMAFNTNAVESMVPVTGAYSVTKTWKNEDFEVPFEIFFKGEKDGQVYYDGFDNLFQAKNNIEWTVTDPDHIIKNDRVKVTHGKILNPANPDPDNKLITSIGTVTVDKNMTGKATINVKYSIGDEVYRTQLTLIVEKR